MRLNGIYPLVNVDITIERSTMLSMGNVTISMAIFSSYVTNYQIVPVMYTNRKIYMVEDDWLMIIQVYIGFKLLQSPIICANLS